ncbi:MAG TPA: hypothetical protein V6D10_17265 [Trichocoleus sp.]
MTLALRSPTRRHWKALEAYLQPVQGKRMKVEEFLEIWNVSREELAFICDCSVTTVNHWFSQGDHRRVPTEKHKQRLALAHHIWITVETEPEHLRVLRELYNKKRRKQ